MQLIEKPWGKEEVVEINDKYMMKRLTMNDGHRCSLQLHRKKCETIYVLSGELTIVHGPDCEHLTKTKLSPGEDITIRPGVVHRMQSENGDSVYLEASTPEMDDVVRLSDDYQRAAL